MLTNFFFHILLTQSSDELSINCERHNEALSHQKDQYVPSHSSEENPKRLTDAQMAQEIYTPFPQQELFAEEIKSLFKEIVNKLSREQKRDFVLLCLASLHNTDEFKKKLLEKSDSNTNSDDKLSVISENSSQKNNLTSEEIKSLEGDEMSSKSGDMVANV